jgi:4-hydroxy-3-methylbut-2-en-1-yl diphosphate reductase
MQSLRPGEEFTCEDLTMNVVLAETAGMCFGVRDALNAMRTVPQPETVTVHGQLVHNEVVLQQLERRGFRSLAEDQRELLPDSPTILITAHGISDRERDRLQSSGKRLIDTTCPLVKRAHTAAITLRDRGYHVVVIGKPGHVEVRGMTEDLPSHTVVPDLDSVQPYPHAKLGVMCQTTTPPRLAAAIHAEIVRRNPHAEVKWVDTICHPTRNQQTALEDLLPQVDCVVVVGGKNSNNTRELARLARDRGVRAIHVAEASELRAEWFANCERVGLTAGTSTLAETIDEVRHALEGFAEIHRNHPSCEPNALVSIANLES